MLALAWLVWGAGSGAATWFLARPRPRPELPRRAAGPWRRALARFRHDRTATVALGVVIALVLLALLAPWLAPYDPDFIPSAAGNAAPSWQHLFGTDFAGRDLLSRVIAGTRVSLSIALLATLVSITVGTTYGAVAGYYGGLLDDLLMRGIDVALAIPRIVLLIAIAVVWGTGSILDLVLLIGLTGWFTASRLVRAEVLSLREREMIVAARALGAGDAAIIARHVIPNVLSPVVVAATLGIGNVVGLEAALSYLGIGAQPPTASLGTLLNEGAPHFTTLWWTALFPGIAIVLLVFAMNLVGDGLRDALDPRQLDGS